VFRGASGAGGAEGSASWWWGQADLQNQSAWSSAEDCLACEPVEPVRCEKGE
jgi:hypothetical protein